MSRLTHKAFFESPWDLIRGYCLMVLPNEAKKYGSDSELSIHLQKVGHIFQVLDINEGVFTFGYVWPSIFTYRNTTYNLPGATTSSPPGLSRRLAQMGTIY